MMNNQKWSLGIVGIAIASGIVISSSVSAQSGDHDIGGTRIQNSNIVNPGGGSTSGGGDNSPTRRATINSANELSNRIQQVLSQIAAIEAQIAAIEAAQKAAQEGPVHIVISKDKECLTPEQLEELQQELEELKRERESLLKEAQQLTEEQNQTQPNNGSW